MQRSPIAVVALAVLLVTAGCNGPALGGDGGGDPADSEAANSVPGVENGQVTNATALLAAHDRALVESGFETDVRVNATVVQQDQVVEVQRRQQTVVEPGRSEFQYRTVNGQNSSFVQFDHWGNESVWVVRGRLGDTTRYQVRDQQVPTERLTGTALLRNYINVSNATAVNVSEEGDLTLVTFETTTLPRSRDGLPANGSDVRDYRARFVVDTEGRVHGLVVEGTYDLRGEARTFDVTYNLQRLDSPTVERPDWVGAALANSST
jgi:hypothetical protein